MNKLPTVAPGKSPSHSRARKAGIRPSRFPPALKLGTALLGALISSGCTTLPPGTAVNPQDPYESYNRTMYQINDSVDRALMRPVAQGYRDVTPGFVQSGVRNFFNNISDLATAVNDFFQGKGSQGIADGGRFLLNTTAGLLGLIDVATPAGLERHQEDFGQTMAVWGWNDSAYLVLPLLGPSTVRDGLGRIADYPESPFFYMNTTFIKESEVAAIQTLDTRTNLLVASKVLDTAALDPYAFSRDAYLQHRRSQIYDGNPPDLPEDQ